MPWAGFELGSLGLQGLSLCATNWTTLTSCNQIEWTKENSAKLYQCRKGTEIVFFASASKLIWNLKNLKHRVTSKAILSQEVRKENLTLNHAKVTEIFWTFFYGAAPSNGLLNVQQSTILQTHSWFVIQKLTFSSIHQNSFEIWVLLMMKFLYIGILYSYSIANTSVTYYILLFSN